MRVKEIMTNDVMTTSPERPLVEASEKMRKLGIRHLVVLEQSKLAGVLSNRDLAAISRRELEMLRVRDVMARQVITIDPEATIARAANTMCNRSVGCLPVVQEGKLAGIVTTTDLLALLGRAGQGTRATVRDRGNRRRAPHAER